MTATRLRIGAVLFVLLSFAIVVRADPVITLPLNGYYRPGKFFPVSVTSDKPVTVQIDIENGIGSRATGTALTLPMMLLSREGSIRVTIDGKPTDVPVRALETNQKLLMVLSTDFPTMPKVALSDASIVVVSVPLQPGQITQAYESADLLGVPDSLETDLNAQAYRSFRSLGGIVLRLPASAMRTPFRPVPSAVVTVAYRGPTTSLDNAGVYDAVSALTAGRSPGVRRTIGLTMVLFAIVTLAVALLGRRWSAYAVAAIALAWVAVGGAVLAKQSPITEWQADIMVSNPQVSEQRDRWVFRTTLRETADTFDTGYTVCRPLFDGQASSLHMWVEPLGLRWAFHYVLPRGGKIGFICRSSTEIIPASSELTEAPRFGEIVRRYYQRPGEVAEPSAELAGRSEVWTVHPAK